MVELCIMASSTCVPGLFHQEQGLARSSKEVLSIVPSPLRKQEMLRSGLLNAKSSVVGDPLKPMGWLFSDQNVRLDSTGKPVLIDIQDTRPDSILFSYGISEHCTRRAKIVQYLMSASSEPGKGGLDFSLLSSLAGLQTSTIEKRLRSLLPYNDGVGLYNVGCDESQSSIVYPSAFHTQTPLLDPVADFSKMTVHPDGRVLFSASDIGLKDLVSIFEECDLLKKSSVRWRKQQMLVPHFQRPDTNESYMNVHESSLKTETMTFAPLKSPERNKLKPSPKKRSNRKAGREQDIYRRSSFHACESLLSILSTKNHGKEAISSLKKSGPELSNLLTQFSAGIAGTGLAVLFSVVCSIASGRTPLYTSTVLNTGFGSALVWLSWAVNKLRDNVVQISKSSSKVGFNEKEMMKKVDNSVNEIFFRAAAAMAVVVLRFA